MPILASRATKLAAIQAATHRAGAILAFDSVPNDHESGHLSARQVLARIVTAHVCFTVSETPKRAYIAVMQPLHRNSERSG